jgi:hypothetical protein
MNLEAQAILANSRSREIIDAMRHCQFLVRQMTERGQLNFTSSGPQPQTPQAVYEQARSRINHLVAAARSEIQICRDLEDQGVEYFGCDHAESQLLNFSECCRRCWDHNCMRAQRRCAFVCLLPDMSRPEMENCCDLIEPI